MIIHIVIRYKAFWFCQFASQQFCLFRCCCCLFHLSFYTALRQCVIVALNCTTDQLNESEWLASMQNEWEYDKIAKPQICNDIVCWCTYGLGIIDRRCVYVKRLNLMYNVSMQYAYHSYYIPFKINVENSLYLSPIEICENVEGFSLNELPSIA